MDLVNLFFGLCWLCCLVSKEKVPQTAQILVTWSADISRDRFWPIRNVSGTFRTRIEEYIRKCVKKWFWGAKTRFYRKWPFLSLKMTIERGAQGKNHQNATFFGFVWNGFFLLNLDKVSPWNGSNVGICLRAAIDAYNNQLQGLTSIPSWQQMCPFFGVECLH